MTPQPSNLTPSFLNPTERALLLLILNGLSAANALALTPEQVDFERGWLLVGTDTIPLTRQSADALRVLPLTAAGGYFPADAPRLPLSEQDAHARLAGALWYTSEDGRLIRETGGFTLEVPILPLPYTYPFSVIARLHPDSLHAAEAQATVQTAMDWLAVELLAEGRVSLVQRVRSALLTGRVIFLLISTGVNGLNFLYNLVIGRLLTPAEYSQITLLITIQLIISLLPSVIQTVSARFSATYAARGEDEALAALIQFGRRWSFRLALGTLALLIVGALPLANLFQITRPELLLPVIIAAPLFVLMGLDRGVLQGTGRYFWLSAAYLAEGVVRFGAGVGLALIVAVSTRVDGAAWGLGQAMIITWFVSWLGLRHFKLPATASASSEQSEWMRLLGFVAISLLGQTLITNSDFMLVKTLFSPEEAGQYAAVTVLGRIAYFGATPLMLLMLPAVARQQALGRPTRPIFFGLMGVVGVFTGALFLVSFLFAPQVLGLLYGDAYLPAAALLPTYTIAASLFVFANVAMTYLVALNVGGGAWMLLAAGVAQIIGILLFHATLPAVIIVQIVIMLLLVIGVLWQALRTADQPMVPRSAM